MPQITLNPKNTPIDLGKNVLSYQEPQLIGQQRTEATFDQAWGRLSNNRWKNVGRMWTIKVFADSDSLVAGDGAQIFMIPPELADTRLIRIVGFVSTQSSSGVVSIQFRNITQSLDVLSTAVTIEANAYTSLTSPTPAVIKTGVIFASGDLVAIDVDGVGTGAKGLGIQLSFI